MWGWDHRLVIEYFPGMCEAWGSILSMSKNKIKLECRVDSALTVLFPSLQYKYKKIKIKKRAAACFMSPFLKLSFKMFYFPIVYSLFPKFLIKGTILSLGSMLKCFTFNYLVLFFLAKWPGCLPKRTKTCLPSKHLLNTSPEAKYKTNSTKYISL